MHSAAPLAAITLTLLVACGGGGQSSPRTVEVTVPPARTSETPQRNQPVASAAPAPVIAESPPPEPAADTPPGPPADAPQGDTCGLRARLRALPSTDGFPHYALTLTNTGKKRVRLVLPGDGSELGWRTPALTWIATANGQPATHAESGRCGMSNNIGEDEIFDLAPGQSREIKEWLGYPRFVPGTYDISVRYRNDPSIRVLKAGVTPAVAQKLASSSTCDVTTNSVVTTIKP